MTVQRFQESLVYSTSAATAVASTTTETILVPDVTLPANYMQDGRVLRVRANGSYSTLGSGTVTVLFGFRWGGVAGTIITKTAAITQLISMTNAFWDIDVILTTRSNGSAGSIIGGGTARVFGGTAPTIGSATGAPAIAPFTNGGQTVPAAASSLDLTSPTALSFTVTHGASNASNTITCQQYLLESLN